ncbi:MAG: hypothetical protein KKD48_03560, partial [Nanoarchaeota archaeon]|nr:hypothetical protein [Nanoarchaeota archaeon]
MGIFRKEEIKYYLITILLIAFIFGFNDRNSIFMLSSWITNFILVLIVVSISFSLAHIMHKLVAQRLFAESEYELWSIRRWGFEPHQKTKILKREFAFPIGIIFSVLVTLISNGFWYFPLVGTYKLNEEKIKRIGKIFVRMTGYERALIYLAIPLTYLGLFFIFLFLTKITGINFGLFVSINQWMAIFSLLPLPNLIGAEILFGSLMLYLFSIVFIIISLLLAPISLILAVI